MLGHAQESVGSLVEAAEDMAQEVRGQCSLRPCQETRGVGCRKGTPILGLDCCYRIRTSQDA